MTEIKEGTVQILEDAAPARLDLDVCRTTTPNVSVRAADGDEGEDTPVLEGHFSTFDDWYEINSWLEGHFLERIAPGAFKRTFKAAKSSKDKHRIQVLLEHGFDPQVGDKPLGVATTLEEDSDGARYEAELFDASYVRDLIPALRAGVYGSSFRFQVIKDEWDEEPEASDHNPKGLPERTIKEVRVAEFGPTVFPANPNADAGVRSTTDEFYEKLRSRNEDRWNEVVARAAKSRGSKVLLGDEEAPEQQETTEAPVETENDADRHEADLENEVENRDETPTEDSLSEHSEDSRNEVEDAPSTHSEDSQDESTPASEGDVSRNEDAETINESCEHTGCQVWNSANRSIAGRDTEWKCLNK